MVLFQWDKQKADANKRKHGIAFEDAVFVFDDPAAIFEPDRVVDGEIRWQTIGRVGDVLVLMVAHTLDQAGEDEVVRIISARRASRNEHKRYEQNRYENFG
jgi:uncharacterized DUF497 family protein